VPPFIYTTPSLYSSHISLTTFNTMTFEISVMGSQSPSHQTFT